VGERGWGKAGIAIGVLFISFALVLVLLIVLFIVLFIMLFNARECKGCR
jgi:uncharacterized membrane protein